jgi:hypothetical protein
VPAIVVGLLSPHSRGVRVPRPAHVQDGRTLRGIVAVFALLFWLSIGFNMLLLGGAWTHVRAVALSQAAPDPDEGAAGS